MSFKKNSLLLLVFGLLLALSVQAYRPKPWSDPGCKIFSPDGCYCLCCSHRWFKNSNGCCQKVSDLCRDWDRNTGCCTCCFDGYKLVNGQCCKVGTASPKFGLKGSFVQQPASYPTYDKPVSKPFVGKGYNVQPTYNKQPSSVSSGWGVQTQSKKTTPQWAGKSGYNSDSYKPKPVVGIEKPSFAPQKPQVAGPNILSFENSGKVDLTGNGKETFVNALNGGSGYKASNNSTETVNTTDSGWVNKLFSENTNITKIKINLGNINKGYNGGDMSNQFIVNAMNQLSVTETTQEQPPAHY